MELCPNTCTTVSALSSACHVSMLTNVHTLVVWHCTAARHCILQAFLVWSHPDFVTSTILNMAVALLRILYGRLNYIHLH